MKRYLVFFGESYYPEGGWSDLKQDFNSIGTAREFVRTELESSAGWYQIIQLEAGPDHRIVEQGSITEHGALIFNGEAP